ncbi:MAG: arsenate reductase ArsC [Verrucomicrobiota bacterium]|nr:arsenate reductase ArsC [Verrucomicrobiota bacterium]
MKKPKVLILCTGNSCRSHMAEAILRSAASDLMDVYSAGSNPKGEVHPLAIEAIESLGISAEGHRSEHLENYLDAGITTVITVCGNADQACPRFPGIIKRYHWGFEDPPHSIRSGETERDAFYRIRDSIKLVFEAYASGYRDAINHYSEYEK